MDFVVWLDNVDRYAGGLVGGKGANLGEMVRLKLPVPFGFVITTNSFNKFLEINRIKETVWQMANDCDVDNTQQLMDTSKKIKDLIIQQEIPQIIKSAISDAYRNLSYSQTVMDEKLMHLISAGRDPAVVAVRSSATTEDLPSASFAGQQASFLNVKGQKDLEDKVKKAWASLYEPRAIFYRRKHGFKTSSIALVVQKMISSDKSGVMFTVNPSTGDNVILIEATWGLGETLVSGEVEPDRYIVSRDKQILEKYIGRKNRMKVRDPASDRTVEIDVPSNKIDSAVLTDEEILNLAEYGLQLENHYKKPQDVEFAIERNRIYVVQTRAVTTEIKKQRVEVSGEPILKGVGSSPGQASGVVRIINSVDDLTKIQPGNILVTKMTSPDMVVAMSKCRAIIADDGGITAHASIVGREMGLPVVVGTQNATKVLKDGQIVTVDAYNGLVYPGNVEIPAPSEAHTKKDIEVAKRMEEGVIYPHVKRTKTAVKVNLVFADNLEDIAYKSDGVGLLRIEHLITKAGIHPAKLIREGKAEEYIQILLDGIEPIVKAFHIKPVWVRTLDARSDEFRNLSGGEDEPQEANPMLGWHGIRRSLDDVAILKAEFTAIKRLHEQGFDNVHIMLPFVISVDEFFEAKEIAKEVGLPTTAKIGIMVETPAAAITVEDFCREGVDFISFGTNDLSQLTLGVDRNNAKIAHLFRETHPAVEMMIKSVVDICKEYDVETSVCGEAPSNIPEFVEFLVKVGINSISVEMDAIDKVRNEVAKVEEEMAAY